MATVSLPTDVRKPIAGEARPSAREELAAAAPERVGEWLRDYLVSWTEDYQARLDQLTETHHDPAATRELLLGPITNLEMAAQATGEMIRRTIA